MRQSRPPGLGPTNRTPPRLSATGRDLTALTQHDQQRPDTPHLDRHEQPSFDQTALPNWHCPAQPLHDRLDNPRLGFPHMTSEDRHDYPSRAVTRIDAARLDRRTLTIAYRLRNKHFILTASLNFLLEPAEQFF